MSFYTRKNLVISAAGPNSLLLKPTTNGEVLVFDASLGSFVPSYSSPDGVLGINEGAGVPVLENQIGQDLYFNSLVPGTGVSIAESAGEITISAQSPVIVVATITDRDALTSLNIGQLVFVQNKGDGEYAIYLWNGSSYATISTQESSKVDAGTLEAVVTFSSSSQVVIGEISPGRKVVEVCVDVLQAFNGVTPTLTIGDDTNGATVIMDSSVNDLTVVNDYSIDCSFYYMGSFDTTIKIYLNLGGSTQGQAEITVTYV